MKHTALCHNLLAPDIIHFPTQSWKRVKRLTSWYVERLMCSVVKGQSKVTVGNRALLSQLADGGKCSLFSMVSNQLGTEFLSIDSETPEVTWPSSFLPPMGPLSQSHATHSLWSPLCSGPTSLPPSITLKALVQALVHPSHWKPWYKDRALGQPRLAANDTTHWLRLASPEGFCLQPGKPDVVSSKCPAQKVSCPQLFHWDSVPTKHQLGSNASGKEVSQEIIYQKRTWTQADFGHLYPTWCPSESMVSFSKSVPRNPGTKVFQNQIAINVWGKTGSFLRGQ